MYIERITLLAIDKQSNTNVPKIT